jgi:hypothetical protein
VVFIHTVSRLARDGRTMLFIKPLKMDLTEFRNVGTTESDAGEGGGTPTKIHKIQKKAKLGNHEKRKEDFRL